MNKAKIYKKRLQIIPTKFAIDQQIKHNEIAGIKPFSGPTSFALFDQELAQFEI
jgi:hypothetical protein